MLRIDFAKSPGQYYEVPLENIKGTLLKNIVETFPNVKGDVIYYTDVYSTFDSFKNIYNILMNKRTSLDYYTEERGGQIGYYGLTINDLRFDAEWIATIISHIPSSDLYDECFEDGVPMWTGCHIDDVLDKEVDYDVVKFCAKANYHSLNNRFRRDISSKVYRKNTRITIGLLVDEVYDNMLGRYTASCLDEIVVHSKATDNKLVFSLYTSN